MIQFKIKKYFLITEAETILDGVLNHEIHLPVVLSSSLDQTIRIWDITEGKCLRELYLYNRVNHFQINETAFVIALNGGKIQYWNNLTQLISAKCFEDSDSAVCVKVRSVNTKNAENDSKMVYGMSQNGFLKVYTIDETKSGKPVFELNDESDVYSLCKDLICFKKSYLNIYISKIIFGYLCIVSKSHCLRKNFKCFELINADQVVLINDNQSFIIFHDIKKSKFI